MNSQHKIVVDLSLQSPRSGWLLDQMEEAKPGGPKPHRTSDLLRRCWRQAFEADSPAKHINFRCCTSLRTKKRRRTRTKLKEEALRDYRQAMLRSLGCTDGTHSGSIPSGQSLTAGCPSTNRPVASVMRVGLCLTASPSSWTLLADK